MPKPKKSLESHRESPSETCFEDAPLFFGPKKTEQVKGRKREEKRKKRRERRRRERQREERKFMGHLLLFS